MDKKDPEVQKYVKQAHHNFTFFCEVHSKLPNMFFDWKITVLFYTAVHALRAIMNERDILIGNSHFDLKRNIDPKNPAAEKPVKKFCFDAYVVLYNASMESRYSGFIEPNKRKAYLKSRFLKCRKAIALIDSYLTSQGYKGFLSIQEEFEFDDTHGNED